MHSTQKPLSAIDLESTQANFPALQHHFSMNETSGTALVDSVGGVSMNVDTLTGDGIKITATTQAASAAITGSWANIGTKHVVIMAVAPGDPNDNFNITLGLTTATKSGFQFFITDGGGTKRFRGREGTDDDAANANFADANDAIEGFLMRYEVGTSLRADHVTSAGVYTAGTAETTESSSWDFDSGTALSDVAQTIIFRYCYGLSVFYFDTLPTDLPAAMAWMRDDWSSKSAGGTNGIYPGWKDRA